MLSPTSLLQLPRTSPLGRPQAFKHTLNPRRTPTPAIISFSITRLQPLASLFGTPFVCFQCFAASFAKNGGWVYALSSGSYEMVSIQIFRRGKSFASYHIPPTPAPSCSYELFCATAPSYPSYSQSVPHSFSRIRGWHPHPPASL